MKVGRYEILGEVGRGGLGAVMRAVDPALGREVAIKFLLEIPAPGSHGAQRFEREMQALARTSHPGVIGIHDTGGEQDRGLAWENKCEP